MSELTYHISNSVSNVPHIRFSLVTGETHRLHIGQMISSTFGFRLNMVSSHQNLFPALIEGVKVRRQQ